MFRERSQRTRRISVAKPSMCSRVSRSARSASPSAIASVERGVLGDVGRQVRELVHDQAPDPGRQVVVADQDVLEVSVARGAVDHPMHRHVEPHQGGPVVTRRIETANLLGHGAQLGPHLVGRGGRRSVGGERLELLAQVGDGAQLGDVDRRRERAAARVGDDQMVGLQAFEGLSHRSAAESEGVREPAVVDRLARPDVQHDQPIPDALVGRVRQRDRCADRRRGGRLNVGHTKSPLSDLGR